MEFYGNGCVGATVAWEIRHWKRAVIFSGIASLAITALLILLGYWAHYLQGAGWLLPLACVTVVCYFLSQVTVTERVTVISEVGVYIEHTLVCGLASHKFLPFSAVQGLCVYETISQQCVVWVLGVLKGDGQLEPLFTAFQLTPEQIRQVYRTLNQHMTANRAAEIS